jgi:hypothetical protein
MAKEKSGFTNLEKKCHDALMESYGKFIEMDREHPNEMAEFVDAIHKIQGILAVRVLRRDYPDYWPTHKDIPDQDVSNL